MIKSYKDLVVWQKSMFLVKTIYIVTKKLPKEETYALADQMRRACVSVASNIAEGYERGSTKEYVQFLVIARASKAELETQLQICTMLNYLTTEEIAESLTLCEEVGKMLNSIINKLKLPNP